MFEDRRRGKRKIVILIIGLILIAAFSISYYISMGIENEANSFSKVNESLKEGLKIPDSLKEIKQVDASSEKNEDKTAGEEDFILNENYKIKYVTLFSLCKHRIEREIDLPSVFIGLNEEQFMEKNTGWDLLEINHNTITLKRDIYTYCPQHFIIGLDDQYIAIYVYNEDGERILKERTDISIDTLTPEDQEILDSGIVADTEDDLEQKLEGFSN